MIIFFLGYEPLDPGHDILGFEEKEIASLGLFNKFKLRNVIKSPELGLLDHERIDLLKIGLTTKDGGSKHANPFLKIIICFESKVEDLIGPCDVEIHCTFFLVEIIKIAFQ